MVSGGASCYQWHWLNTFSAIWLVVSGVGGNEDRLQNLIMGLIIMMTCKISPYTLYEGIFHVIVIVVPITYCLRVLVVPRCHTWYHMFLAGTR